MSKTHFVDVSIQKNIVFTFYNKNTDDKNGQVHVCITNSIKQCTAYAIPAIVLSKQYSQNMAASSHHLLLGCYALQLSLVKADTSVGDFLSGLRRFRLTRVKMT